jgi:SAM-dependent methyltransferase
MGRAAIEHCMQLLSEETLERSTVVANCRMNRERVLFGSNGYARELGFDPVAVLTDKLACQGGAAWLDLCCGTGRALIEAGQRLQAKGRAGAVEIVGIDLVGMFDRPPPGLTGVSLVEASLRRWNAVRTFDLVTCVHGLHYVGDKLGLIARAVSWLAADGLFVANLDLANLKFGDGRLAGRRVAAELRRCGLEYDRKRRLLRCRGKCVVHLPLRFLGADDGAGPNYTGQPAVDSYYEGD